MAVTNNYLETTNMLAANYDEFDGESFYNFIFPNCECSGELKNDYSQPNAVYLFKDEESDKEGLTRRIMLQDTWSSDFINNIEGKEIALCSGLSYRGRANTLENAQQMNALVFDLDGVGAVELRNLFIRFTEHPMIRPLPMPTFLVCSGNGLHIYYVFEKPIDLYPNIKFQLKSLNHDLTYRLWDYTVTTQHEEIQYQSINQSFRMVGSTNSKYGNTVRAFKVGEKTTIDELNKFVSDESNKVDLQRPFRPTKISKAQAKELYPEWYERVIVKGSKAPKKWDIAGKVNGNNPYALYDWWRKKAENIVGGHRYFFMFCMSVYACKCDVPKAKLKADLKEVYETLKKIDHDNSLTEEDMLSALEGYSREFYNFTIDDIAKVCGVRIDKNKRNGRKQSQHLKYARGVKNVKLELGEDVAGGRPSAKNTIVQYRFDNPEAKPKDCIADTGLSKNTVYKWWNTAIIVNIDDDFAFGD